MPRGCGSCGPISSILLAVAAVLLLADVLETPAPFLGLGSVLVSFLGLVLGVRGLIGDGASRAPNHKLYRVITILNGALLIGAGMYLIL